MGTDDAMRWDARYAGRPIAEPAVPDALVAADLVALVPESGRALDIACGVGAQSLWLAARGLDVVAIDVSPTAIDLTTRAAVAAGLGDRVETRVVDLDHGIPADLDTFDVIVCQRFRAVDLYASYLERVRSGGIVVVTVLSRTGADAPGPFHAPSGELRAAFTRPDTELLFHQEADGLESIVARQQSAP